MGTISDTGFSQPRKVVNPTTDRRLIIYNNMLVEELLKFVDRRHPQVKALAEALEVEIENNENCGGLGQK